MNKNNRGRRGATLAELAVVIAVIAIVAVMVTSFIVMIDGSRDISQMKLEAMQDIVLAESVIESFIETSANDGKIIAVTEQSLMAQEVGSVKFLSGFLTVSYNDVDRENVVLELETVTGIKFSTLDGGKDILYYCTITYDIGGTEFDYTFCVNPYAGENIKEVTP